MNMNTRPPFHRLLPGGACATLLIAALACGGSVTPTATPTPKATETPVPTFIPTSALALVTMRLDVVGVPAGWMSGGTSPADFISLESGSNCHTDADCVRFTYEAGGGWAGVLWWPLGCDWSNVNQSTCGINVLERGGFDTVDSLAFWARGEQGGEKIEFVVGSDPGGLPPLPRRSLGAVVLGTTWQQYEIVPSFTWTTSSSKVYGKSA
jgi:hypothetical protein